jgi:hypothetical protein
VGALLGSIPSYKRAGLLEAKGPDDVSVLYAALQKGRSETIVEWGKLLPAHASPYKQAEMLATKGPDGLPGIFVSIQHSKFEANAAWTEILAQLEDGPRDSLILELDKAMDEWKKNGGGLDPIPGIYEGMVGKYRKKIDWSGSVFNSNYQFLFIFSNLP